MCYSQNIFRPSSNIKRKYERELQERQYLPFLSFSYGIFVKRKVCHILIANYSKIDFLTDHWVTKKCISLSNIALDYIWLWIKHHIKSPFSPFWGSFNNRLVWICMSKGNILWAQRIADRCRTLSVFFKQSMSSPSSILLFYLAKDKEKTSRMTIVSSSKELKWNLLG